MKIATKHPILGPTWDIHSKDGAQIDVDMSWCRYRLGWGHEKSALLFFGDAVFCRWRHLFLAFGVQRDVSRRESRKKSTKFLRCFFLNRIQSGGVLEDHLTQDHVCRTLDAILFVDHLVGRRKSIWIDWAWLKMRGIPVSVGYHGLFSPSAGAGAGGVPQSGMMWGSILFINPARVSLTCRAACRCRSGVAGPCPHHSGIVVGPFPLRVSSTCSGSDQRVPGHGGHHSGIIWGTILSRNPTRFVILLADVDDSGCHLYRDLFDLGGRPPFRFSRPFFPPLLSSVLFTFFAFSAFCLFCLHFVPGFLFEPRPLERKERKKNLFPPSCPLRSLSPSLCIHNLGLTMSREPHILTPHH